MMGEGQHYYNWLISCIHACNFIVYSHCLTLVSFALGGGGGGLLICHLACIHVCVHVASCRSYMRALPSYMGQSHYMVGPGRPWWHLATFHNSIALTE